MEDTLTFAVFLRPATELPGPLAAVALTWALLVGLSVGSFLNVVIARLPQGESLSRPRSRCPGCKTQIAWYDNVPVLSWILLRARCRRCGVSISARYPFVEALIGVLALALVARYGLSLAALEMFVFACVLVALAFIDLDTWTVPFELLYVITGAGLVMGALGAVGVTSTSTPVWLAAALEQTPLEGLVERGVGLVAGFLSLACVNVVFTVLFRLRGRIPGDEWAMGWGDPLLLAGMGAVLGWRALPLVIFLSSVQGSVVGIALRLTGRMPGDSRAPDGEDVDPSAELPAEAGAGSTQEGDGGDDDEEWVPPPTALPFVPFLALAGLEVAFFGDRILGLISRVMGSPF